MCILQRNEVQLFQFNIGFLFEDWGGGGGGVVLTSFKSKVNIFSHFCQVQNKNKKCMSANIIL